mgnify:CR=1 FL=1
MPDAPKKKPPTIEVNGVRFAGEHVESVTIKRDGVTITITKDGKQSETIGFKVT